MKKFLLLFSAVLCFHFAKSQALAVTISHVDVLCYSSCTGSATANPTGGTAPYTYSWNPPASTQTINTLCAGTYIVTVTDAAMATASATVTIMQPQLLTATTSVVNATCGNNNGGATVTVNGGTAPYSYQWNPLGGTLPTISNHAPGTYTCIVTDANGCTVNQIVTIVNMAGPIVTASGTSVSCNSTCDGTATFTQTGGTGPFTELWTPGNFMTQNISSLCPGTYSITVTDANNCVGTSSYTVTQPPALAATYSSTSPTCFAQCNGTATVFPSGGTLPYHYYWNDPMNQTTQTATGLCQMTYTFIVTDNNGCTFANSFPLFQPTQVTTSITPGNSTACVNDVVTFNCNPAGGTSPYIYSWQSNGGLPATSTIQSPSFYWPTSGTRAFTVTVTDANGCSNTATTNITVNPTTVGGTISGGGTFCANLNSGTLTLSGNVGSVIRWEFSTDGGLTWTNVANVTSTQSYLNLLTTTMYRARVQSGVCTYAYSSTATITINPNPTATLSSTNVTCNSQCNGTVSVFPSGGTLPYSYSWNDPMNQSTQTATALCARQYTITVVDAVGCQVTNTVLITEPSMLTATSNFVNATCGNNNGNATVVPSGGTPGYTYLWSPSGGNASTATGLAPGSYTCIITDMNGCTFSPSVVVGNIPGPTATISSQTNILCFGNCTGSGTISYTGGTSPYTYLWTDPFFQTNSTAMNLCAGTYTSTITDANGCVATVTCTITQPPQLVTTITSIIPAGCNMSDGSAITSTVGGTGSLNYAWTPSCLCGSNLSNASAANYSYTVTDVNGCVVTNTLLVTDSCDYVWPGDANEDAVADNNDILAIGIANAATGTTRANASTNWIGQPSANWGQTLLSGTDYKFVDCDGNGIIDPTDTNAVIQNFGFSHNMREGAAPIYDASLPDLQIHMGQSVLAANSQGTLSVSFGTNSIPVSNFYGLAFTMNFDATQIDASTFRMNENGTWMGIPGTDLMGVVLNSGNGTGAVEIAITRLNHANANGFGNIANMSFMTTNDLVGTGNFQNVNFNISDVTVISSNETPQSVNTINDSVIVEDPILLGVNESPSSSVSVFPNPFDESTTIILPATIFGNQNEIVITDLQGRIVRDEIVAGANSFVLQRGDLETGMYFCTVKSNGKIVGVEKIMVK